MVLCNKSCNKVENISFSDVAETGILFRIIDENGNDVPDDEKGLLLYKGGTVCDDKFDYNAAHSICKEMGSPGAQSWESGIKKFDSQDNLDIKLDDVLCLDDHKWLSCSYSESGHNCDHSEDVFLSCKNS